MRSLTFTDVRWPSRQRNSLTNADNRTTCDHATHVAWGEGRDEGGCDNNHAADDDSDVESLVLSVRECPGLAHTLLCDPIGLRWELRRTRLGRRVSELILHFDL